MNEDAPHPRAVLGIDAAWTSTEPSGVALAVETEGGWRLAALEASYDQFLARAKGTAPGEARPGGSRPIAAELLAAARDDLRAARRPRRDRHADVAAPDRVDAGRPTVSSRSATAPWPRRRIRRARSGPARSATGCGRSSRRRAMRFAPRRPRAIGLIEVYPHPALIEFLKAERRLEYKAGKTGVYWPALSLDERHLNLRAVWARIVEALERRIGGVAERLPRPDPEVRGWRLKAYEDRLDAVVCAAVAIACSQRRSAVVHGDDDAAIWVPVPDVAV